MSFSVTVPTSQPRNLAGVQVLLCLVADQTDRFRRTPERRQALAIFIPLYSAGLWLAVRLTPAAFSTPHAK